MLKIAALMAGLTMTQPPTGEALELYSVYRTSGEDISDTMTHFVEMTSVSLGNTSHIWVLTVPISQRGRRGDDTTIDAAWGRVTIDCVNATSVLPEMIYVDDTGRHLPPRPLPFTPQRIQEGSLDAHLLAIACVGVPPPQGARALQSVEEAIRESRTLVASPSKN